MIGQTHLVSDSDLAEHFKLGVQKIRMTGQTHLVSDGDLAEEGAFQVGSAEDTHDWAVDAHGGQTALRHRDGLVQLNPRFLHPLQNVLQNNY